MSLRGNAAIGKECQCPGDRFSYKGLGLEKVQLVFPSERARNAVKTTHTAAAARVVAACQMSAFLQEAPHEKTKMRIGRTAGVCGGTRGTRGCVIGMRCVLWPKSAVAIACMI